MSIDSTSSPTSTTQTKVATPQSLLDAYTEDSFFFNSPTRALLASQWLERRDTVGSDCETALNALFESARQYGIKNPIIVGALPFANDHHGHLLLPAKWQQQLPITTWIQQQPEAALSTQTLEATPCPDQAGYCAGVEAALKAFSEKRLDKVVLARSLQLKTATPLDPALIIQRLMKRNPDAYVFATPLSSKQSPAVFLGASPELMVRREGKRIIVNPLAGSTARRPDPAEDKAAAQALTLSEKDLHEHAVVIEAVVKALQPLCSQLHVPDGPSLLSTSKLWHLSTVIEGELADPTTSSLTVARALHPTPAVCGFPREEAFNMIREQEPFDRDLFSGLVGWTDASGDGEWALSLRCAALHGHDLTLYAGAGIVPGSEAMSEFAETGTKLATMLAALGLDDALGQLPSAQHLATHPSLSSL